MRRLRFVLLVGLCLLFACSKPSPQKMGTYLPGNGAPPSGAAGGDLAGTYPNPSVAQITGVTGGASTGRIRLASGDQIAARNAGGTADISLVGVDVSDHVLVGNLNASEVLLTSGGGAFGLNSNVFVFGLGVTGVSGTGVVGIANASVAPTTNPTGGGVIFETSGLLAHRGSGGATYGMAPAGSGTTNSQKRQFVFDQATLETSATSTVTIWTSPTVSNSHVMAIKARISSIDTTTLASSASAEVACSFVNSAGTLSQLGTTTTLFNHNYTSAPSCAISGTTVLVQVTPKTADVTDSQADVSYQTN